MILFFSSESSSSSSPNKSKSSSFFFAAGAAVEAPVPGKALRSAPLNELMWLKNLTAWNKSPGGATPKASNTWLSS